jgi:uncharacterized membrane protein YeaQ/YmgE (transglycosylase-associated protein family)
VPPDLPSCGAVDPRIARLAHRRTDATLERAEVVVGIIAWIVLGAIAGYITNVIMGGKEGVVETIILGIVGAVVGGFIAGTVLKVADVTGLNVTSVVVAVIGAVIVVAIYRAVTGRRRAL